MLIIGIVQGITELLPISSTGHILMLGKVLNMGTISSSLLVLFHLGTTVAILLFYGKKLFKNFLKKEKWTFYLKVFVATIPAALAGLLLDDFISEKLRSTWIIALSLIVWGIVMIILEKRKKGEKSERQEVSDIEKITWKQAILIGCSQVIALIPGTSRSGITTIAGILSGLEKYVALEFSFILSIPVLLGAFLLLLREHPIKETILATGISSPLLGFGIIFLSTLIVGLLTLLLLKKVKKRNWLTVFGIYRIILGILLLIIFY